MDAPSPSALAEYDDSDTSLTDLNSIHQLKTILAERQIELQPINELPIEIIEEIGEFQNVQIFAFTEDDEDIWVINELDYEV